MFFPSFELLFAVEENTKGQVEHKYDSQIVCLAKTKYCGQSELECYSTEMSPTTYWNLLDGW